MSGGWIPIYILPASGRGFAFAKQGNYCLPPAGVLHSQNKVINAPPAAAHKGGGGGFAKDMYNNDGGKGGAYAYEAYEAK